MPPSGKMSRRTWVTARGPVSGNRCGVSGASGVCGTCGATGPVAELVVYRQAPGTVVRCRACESILMVFVKVRGMTCVDLTGMARLDRPRAA